ncbi:hypothetical protein [Actinomadura keratinilytica]|uniref:Uncharacterized protein n=1 Tax=Actinomadura keratinilytica TaxID=547461 RepID=A0ABP7ZE61_9ACTN
MIDVRMPTSDGARLVEALLVAADHPPDQTRRRSMEIISRIARQVILGAGACHYCGGSGRIGASNKRCRICGGSGSCPGGRR